MTRTIDLPPGAAAIVTDILRAHLAPGTQAWAFGSRATGTARRYSDLDLALQAPSPIDPAILADIAEALSESDLPIKVDVIDLGAVEPRFRALIEPTLLPLPF